MTNQIDDKLIERMKKLLALATNNDNEHQATAAMAKLQEMLEAHNLEMADLGKSGKGAQRSDTKKTGGLYGWQRKLWQSVAKLNFCYYFSLRGLDKGSVYEHRLVGSHANVVATELMATYLQQTVERLAQQWAKDNFYKSVFVREAIAYREGMAARICERLETRRHQMVTEARREAEERKRNEAHGNMPATGNALTIIDVISSEEDFNNDYLQGWEMGTTARNRAEADARHKAWAAKRAAEEAAKSPEQKAREVEEAKRQLAAWVAEEEKRAKRRNKTPPKPRYRKQTAEEARMDLGSYWDGRRTGDTVGIDTQVDQSKRKAIG